MALILVKDDLPRKPDRGNCINLILKFLAIPCSGPLEVPIQTTSTPCEINSSATIFAGKTCPHVPPERIYIFFGLGIKYSFIRNCFLRNFIFYSKD